MEAKIAGSTTDVTELTEAAEVTLKLLSVPLFSFARPL